MKSLKAFALSAMLVIAIGFASPAALAVSVTDDICKQATNPKPAVCADIDAQKQSSSNPLFGPNGVVTRGINIFTAVVGVIAVVMILISGVRFVLSTGDTNTTTSARNGIIFAAIGLAIVAFSQVIVQFVIKKL